MNKANGSDMNKKKIPCISSLITDFIDIGFNLVKVYI